MCNQLNKQIKRTIIKANNRSRIKDIAQKAGISIGTVDRVIHNRGEVSESTRKKILAIIDELDYKPNMLASTLASKKTYSFALLFPEPISVESYWNKPMIGVRNAFQEIQQYGVNINIHLYKQNQPETFSIEALKIMDNLPDGVVLAPFFLRESVEFIKELDKRKIPYIFIDSNIPDHNQLSYIGQDSFQSGMLAARLLDYSTPKNSSILVLQFAKELDNLNHLIQREKGFYDYFNKRGISRNRKIFTIEAPEPDEISFQEKLISLLNENPEIRGIFVTNSQVYYLARILARYEIQGLRIIGHDLINENISFLKNGLIDFLICQRPEEQGYLAINKLFENVVLKKEVSKQNYTSIDIVTKENIDYYK